MEFKLVTLYLILGLCYVHYTSQFSMYDLVVKRINCFELTGHPDTVNCSVKLINRTTTFMNIFYKPALDYYLLPRFTMSYKFSNNEYRRFLIDVTEDICEYFQGRTLAPLMDVFWNDAKNFTNLNDCCPFRKGREYYIKDFSFRSSNFPPGMPSGYYRFEIIIMKRSSKMQVGFLQVYAELKRKPAADILWN